MRKTVLLLAFMAMALLLASGVAYAAAGDLDRGFDGNGKVTTAVGEYGSSAHAVLAQPDGKIVAAGSSYTNGFALARYSANGTLDDSFGGDGTVTTSFADLDPETTSGAATDVALQRDGKIVAGGTACATGDYCVQLMARYNPDGTLDETFSEDGRVIIGAVDGILTGIAQVRIQPDGKIVTAGGYTVVRHNPDGTLDRSFGDGGFTTTDQEVLLYGLALQRDGKIVVGGDRRFDPKGDFSLIRFKPSGGVDKTFGRDGLVRTNLGIRGSALLDLALQKDGKIVATGVAIPPGFGDSNFALVRYKPGGKLDRSFGGDGKVLPSFEGPGGGQDRASSVVLQKDGKIIAAGYARVRNRRDHTFGLVRRNPDGSPDNSFGKEGRVTTNFGPKQEVAQDLALQDNGKIVAAGYVEGGDVGERGDPSFALARYQGR